MKNLEKHEGLDSKELRELLAKGLEKTSYVSSIELLTIQLKKIEEDLKLAKEREAYKVIMVKFGWKEIDVSDEIEDFRGDSYFSFVGTEEEKNVIFHKKDLR